MWEYRVCSINYSTKEEFETALNAEGINGWIVCSIVRSAINQMVDPPIITEDIIFRKEIIEEPAG